MSSTDIDAKIQCRFCSKQFQFKEELRAMNTQSNAVKFSLDPSYLKRSFQLATSINTARYGVDATYLKASDELYKWAAKKCSEQFSMPVLRQTYDRQMGDVLVGIVSDDKNHRFVLQLSHGDMKVARRTWSIESELFEKDGRLLFSVKTSCASPANCTQEVPFSIPLFVGDLANAFGFEDIKLLSKNCWEVNTASDVADLIELITDSNRRLPVVVISELKSQTDGSAGGQSYLIDGDALQKRLFCVAHVVRITSEMSFVLTEKLSRPWSVFDGAVRTYYPGFNEDEQEYYEHPLLLKERIISAQEPLADTLVGFIQRRNMSERIDWQPFGCISYYLAVKTLAEAKREAERTAIIAQSSAASNEAAALRERCAAWESFYYSMEESYDAQLREAEHRAEEWERFAEAFEKDATDCKQQYDQEKNRNFALSHYIQSLRGEKSSSTDDNSITLPSSYADVERWISEHYPDRLVLSSKAQRGLKKAVYEDVDKVYKVLILLATKYYDMRKGVISRADFDIACSDIGVSESPSISGVAAGERGEEYYCLYGGVKRLMERHITDGTNRDPRYCLRVYFFWDDDDEAVVLGSLPEHLDTRIT
jgi:hypothetical protein